MTLGALYAECRADAGETGLNIRSDKLPILRIRDFLACEDVQDKAVTMGEDAGRLANRAMDLLEILQAMTALRRTLAAEPAGSERSPDQKTAVVHVLRKTTSQDGRERVERSGQDRFQVPVHEDEQPDCPDCYEIVRDVLEGFILYLGDAIRVEQADAVENPDEKTEDNR